MQLTRTLAPHACAHNRTPAAVKAFMLKLLELLHLLDTGAFPKNRSGVARRVRRMLKKKRSSLNGNGGLPAGVYDRGALHAQAGWAVQLLGVWRGALAGNAPSQYSSRHASLRPQCKCPLVYSSRRASLRPRCTPAHTHSRRPAGTTHSHRRGRHGVPPPPLRAQLAVGRQAPARLRAAALAAADGRARGDARDAGGYAPLPLPSLAVSHLSQRCSHPTSHPSSHHASHHSSHHSSHLSSPLTSPPSPCRAPTAACRPTPPPVTSPTRARRTRCSASPPR